DAFPITGYADRLMEVRIFGRYNKAVKAEAFYTALRNVRLQQFPCHRAILPVQYSHQNKGMS
ncbi:MAG: hypothetical protein PHU22_11470, partial [Eubacteriales bacterium]|nr:hypothetical protein [Eubacteriales bacterium]